MSEKPENEDQLNEELQIDTDTQAEDIQEQPEELEADGPKADCDPAASPESDEEEPAEDEPLDAAAPQGETPDQTGDEEPQTELLPVVDPFQPEDEAPEIAELPVIDASSAEGPLPVLEARSDDADDAEGSKSHALRNSLIAVVVIIVIALAAFCGWLVYDDSQNASCHVPQGVTLDGTDMSGRSEAEVSSLVKKNIREGLTGDTVLHVGDDKEYSFNIVQMGSIDVDATVDAVMGTIDPSLSARCVNRALGLIGAAPAPEPQELTTVCSLNKKKVKARVQEIADELDSDARDAGYVFDSAKREVETVSAKTGYKVNVKKTTKAVLNASKEGSASVDAVATVTKPTKTDLGQAIYVDLNECHLYFYVDGKVKRDYPCTPGKSGYNTPSGTWYLEYKDPSPVWINPHSDWSKNMPETIEPGESNPLGLRALAVSCGGGIYIHGTTNTGELGTKASHGCVRLANANVVELYDLVETGIPIFIY